MTSYVDASYGWGIYRYTWNLKYDITIVVSSFSFNKLTYTQFMQWGPCLAVQCSSFFFCITIHFHWSYIMIRHHLHVTRSCYSCQKFEWLVIIFNMQKCALEVEQKVNARSRVLDFNREKLTLRFIVHKFAVGHYMPPLHPRVHSHPHHVINLYHFLPLFHFRGFY